MEIAEHLLGPQVDAALTGIAMGKFDDRDSLRPEEEKKRNNPQPDRYPAVRRNGRQYIEIEDGNDEEQNEVPAPQNALQTRRRASRFTCVLGDGQDLAFQLSTSS